MITVGSLFDGIGGTLLCSTMCGAVPLWASEIEKFPIAVTKHHFHDVIHLGDITQINGAEIPPVDIIVGGSPCQDLSVAGKRAGMAGARSGLFMEQIRIIKELRNATGTTYPRFMVWENVPGAFSSNGGEDFRSVLEETARIADPTISIPRSVTGWANAGSILGVGFSISWRTIDAQYWGVPQRRRRIYLVSDFGGQSAPEILFEREGLSWHPAQSQNEGQGTSGNADERIEDAVQCLTPWDCQSKRIFDPSGCYPTLQAMGEGGANNTAVVCFSNSGFSNFKKDEVSATQRVCVAKQVDVDLVVYGICSYESNSMKSDNPHSGIYEADTARTLDQNGGNPACNQGGMAVVFENHPGDSRVTGPHNVCPTATGRWGTCGGNVPFVMAHGQANAEIIEDCSPTLNCNHEQPIVATRIVRRLIPLECERLQGYPDNYTNIPGSSDSTRYKGLGNSFSIPCALFVISGCVQKLQEENNAT